MAKTYKARVKKIHARIEGAEEVVRVMQDMGQSAEDILQQAADAGGRIALDEAKRRCPVRTGKLKASLVLEPGRKTPVKGSVRIVHGKKEFYGKFVELGTKKIAARPFMRPAVDENRDRIAEKITEEIGKAVDRVM